MTRPRTIQTKRTRPKKVGFRKLHAATRSTRKRKQRVATTANAEDFGEVPGVGVPLALVVILLLHVAAIAGIWIHDKWSSSSDLSESKPALKEDLPPSRVPGLSTHLVNEGETAESIAQMRGVSVAALKRVNEGISEYQAGWTINIPNRPVQPATTPREVEPTPPIATITPVSRPRIQTSNEESLPGSVPGELVEVGSPEPAGSNVPVLIKPRTPVRPRVASAGVSSRLHEVQQGETLWRIATDNGISVEDLTKANPGVSASSLKIGRKLVIPPKQ